MRAPGLMSTGAPAFELRPWAHLLRSRGTMARPASPRRLIDSPALRIGQRFAAASKGSGRKTKFHQPDPLWFFRHSVTLLTTSAGCPVQQRPRPSCRRSNGARCPDCFEEIIDTCERILEDTGHAAIVFRRDHDHAVTRLNRRTQGAHRFRGVLGIIILVVEGTIHAVEKSRARPSARANPEGREAPRCCRRSGASFRRDREGEIGSSKRHRMAGISARFKTANKSVRSSKFDFKTRVMIAQCTISHRIDERIERSPATVNAAKAATE